MKHKKQALAKSLLALLLCVAMLAGTTFAWFTDSVVSGINTIAAGNLDVELYHSNAAVSDEKVDANTKLFLDLNGNSILWEPGVVSYENLRVTNEGDLALIYQLAINTANENYILDNGAQYGLSQVLKVGVVAGGITATDRDGVVNAVSSWTTLSAFLSDGHLLAGGEEIWGVVIYWQPSDIDNNWNANNGKTLSSGDALSIDLGIKLTATQMQFEDDSFGPDYDVDASGDVFPAFQGGSASVSVTTDANGNTTEAVTIDLDGITAVVPAGVKLGAGVNTLTLTITDVDTSESNVVLGEDEAMRSLDVHVEGVAADNTTPITILLPKVAPKTLNMGNYKVYHVEANGTNEMTLVANDADFDAHNQFKYDPATGDITLYMASFSEVSVVAEFAKWEGNYDYSWYTPGADSYTIANGDQLAAFGAIVGGMNGDEAYDFAGKTVTLIANIDLNDVEEDGKIFYPIGYYYNGDDSAPYSTVYSFSGTFDGNGHIIKNFYQNTWEIKGDYDGTYYKDAMGLFGYVANGTIKNLTVENFSSDGEFTPTGVIAAYADNSTFESIAIVNCNPRVYNTGNGGIIGIAGERGEAADQKIVLKNITVDNTNKISALWGSWDVACGGLVGMFRGNAEGGQGQIYFENCHVGAQIDVYNDVCANYQYYAYRYSGMLIGSVRCNVTGDDGHVYPNMAGISASNCTVHFGTWNDYYYCELVDNTTASYTHDYQMSRLVEVKAINDNTVTYLDGTTGTIPSSGRANYVIVDYSKGHGDENAECFHYLNGQVWNHADGGEEVVDGQTVLKEDKQHVYREFNNLVTGDGWGVTSKAVGDLDGVIILDRAEASSESKWNPGYADTLITGVDIKLSDLFKQKDNLPVGIVTENVVVSITNLDDSNITAIYTRNDSNWKNSTLNLSGTGRVQITIQDYYFCIPTIITVDVKDPSGVPQVDGNLIQNGTFETGNVDKWTQGSQWSHSTTSVIATKTGYDGLLLTGNGNYAPLLTQSIPVTKGENYYITMWYKVKAHGINITVTGDQTGEVYLNTWELDTDWTKYKETFLVHKDDSSVTVKFACGEVVKETCVFVDDVAVTVATPLLNGDFEDGKDGWTLNKSASIVSGNAYSGDHALKLQNPGSWAEAAVQYIAVEYGTAYELTFYAKRLSGTGVFNIAMIDGENIVGQNWMNETSGEWVKYTIVVAPDAGVTKMGLKFTSQQNNAGEILIDNVAITKSFAYNGTVRDGGFELGYPIKWTLSSGCSISTEAALNGNYGLKLKTTSGSWSSIASHGFATEIDKIYTITLYCKIDSNDTKGGINFEVRHKDGTKETLTHVEGQKYPNGMTDKEWTKHVITFKATSAESYFHMLCNGTSYTATVYVDDITIE